MKLTSKNFWWHDSNALTIREYCVVSPHFDVGILCRRSGEESEEMIEDLGIYMSGIGYKRRKND